MTEGSTRRAQVKVISRQGQGFWDPTAGTNSTLTLVHCTSQFTEHPLGRAGLRDPYVEEETGSGRQGAPLKGTLG